MTTPQPAAQQVAVRAAAMAEKVGMRIVGVVENMSYLVGTGQEIFGSGGGQRLADEIGVPLLGSVPLDPALREAADAGTPDPRGRARRRGDGRDRRARRADPEDAPRHDPQGAHRPLVGRPETPEGARGRPPVDRSSSGSSLVLLQLRAASSRRSRRELSHFISTCRADRDAGRARATSGSSAHVCRRSGSRRSTVIDCGLDVGSSVVTLPIRHVASRACRDLRLVVGLLSRTSWPLQTGPAMTASAP